MGRKKKKKNTKAKTLGSLFILMLALWASCGAQLVKHLPAMKETWV